jgi:hypothetical protein
MISYSGSIVKINLTTESFGVRSNTDRPTSYEEAPWFYKRNNLYYMIFAGGPISEHIAYSTSNPRSLGMGKYAYTRKFYNHGIIDYKETHFFYHNALTGRQFTRSV